MKKKLIIATLALGLLGLAAQTLINLQTQVRGILAVANGGTGTASPGLMNGTNVTITGTWPNQVVNSSAGGGAGGYAVQHEFNLASAGSQTFTHNLGTQYPQYSCATKSGAQFQANWMTWVDANNVTLTAPGATDVVCSFGQTTASTSLSNPAACPDTSGSGTAQSCTTTPTITVAANACIAYTTTTANTGTGLTLAVNGGAAAPVAIYSGGSWTSTLTAGIIAANRSMLACYDGTDWDVQTPVVASSSGPSVVGTASFSLNGGSVSSANYSGVVTSVTRTGTGLFTVNLSSPPSNYLVECTAGATGVGFTFCEIESAMPLSSTALGMGTYKVNAASYVDAKAVMVAIIKP